MDTAFEPIVGRYVTFETGGKACRVYFEEAGAGIPLVCMHTAGADGRQYRHMMNDPEITSRYRLIAPDMPWHGKSNPPVGWQDTEYRLTTAAMPTCAASSRTSARPGVRCICSQANMTFPARPRTPCARPFPSPVQKSGSCAKSATFR